MRLDNEREDRLRFLLVEFALGKESDKHFDVEEMRTLRDDVRALLGEIDSLRAIAVAAVRARNILAGCGNHFGSAYEDRLMPAHNALVGGLAIGTPNGFRCPRLDGVECGCTAFGCVETARLWAEGKLPALKAVSPPARYAAPKEGE